MNMFMYNDQTKTLEINEPEVLLISEFKKLRDRDKTKLKTRLMRELTYIYLALDWQSPYSAYTELERHEEALNDAELTLKEFDDGLFRAACRKYIELLNSNKSVKLLEAAKRTVDLFIDYFETIVDLNERDANGRPVFSTEKVMKEMSMISKVHEELIALEKLVKEDLAQTSGTRGGVEIGFED